MTNLVSAEHLEALAVAAKNYTKNEISKGGVSAAPFILDTVPSTVEGVVWLDESSDEKLVIYHNNQRYYFPLSVLPQITDLTITPPTLAAMQGQSATATITAMTNEQVTGLSYSLGNTPTWITISDDVILIQPSDNDLGQAVVQVYARDTGSDASASAPFIAEALLRPIIESLYVIPPAVTVQQGQSATAGISAVANAAVTGLSFSLNGAPSWVNLNGDVIQMNPTDNDIGDNTVNVVAFDTNSSASAATQFVASAALRPIINAVTANPADVTVNQGQSAFVTLSADANAAVTGLSYSLADAPSWMTLGNDVITIAPTDDDLGSVTVTATARDINSTAQASTTFTATAEEPKITDISITPAEISSAYGRDAYTGITMTAAAADDVGNISFTVQYPSSDGTVKRSSAYTLNSRSEYAYVSSPRLGYSDITITAHDPTSGSSFTKICPVRFYQKVSLSPATLEYDHSYSSGLYAYFNSRVSLMAPPSIANGMTPSMYGSFPRIVTLSADNDSVTGNYLTTIYRMTIDRNCLVSAKANDTVKFYLGRTSNDSYAVTPTEVTAVRMPQSICAYNSYIRP